MKKICLFLICLIIAPILFVGCNKEKDDGFVEVQSITYSIGDNTTTLNSNFKILCNFHDSISYEEYNNASDELILESPPIFNQTQTINRDKTNLKTYKSYIGKTYYYCYIYNPDTPEDSSNRYYKLKFKEIEEYYIYVRVISENIVEIKNSKDEISRVCTTSYQINYFI